MSSASRAGVEPISEGWALALLFSLATPLPLDSIVLFPAPHDLGELQSESKVTIKVVSTNSFRLSIRCDGSGLNAMCPRTLAIPTLA